MRNILFFAEDHALVEKLFATACDFVDRVPIRRLTFYPDGRVWDLAFAKFRPQPRPQLHVIRRRCPRMSENCIYIARSSAIAARVLAGEMMVMNSADSTFFTLNEVATAIWQAADGHTPLQRNCPRTGVRAIRDRSRAGAGRCRAVCRRTFQPRHSAGLQPTSDRGDSAMSLMAKSGRRHSTWACPWRCIWMSRIAATSAACIAISITTTTAR